MGASPSSSLTDPHASNERTELLILAVAVIGCSLYFAGMWSSRNDVSGVPDAAVYVSRCVKMVACLALAFLFSNRLPSRRALFASAASVLALHLLCDFMIEFTSHTSSLTALLFASSLFEGVAGGCTTLLFMQIIAAFEPNRSAVALAMMWTLNEVFTTACWFVPTDVLPMIRMVVKVVAMVVLGICLKMIADINSPRFQRFSDTANGEGHGQSPSKVLFSDIDGLPLLIAMVVFPTVFGVAAKVCSGIDSNSGLYEVANEIVSFAVLVLLILRSVHYGPSFSFAHMLAFVIPLFVVGLVLLSLLWSKDTIAAGTLVKCSYTIFNVLACTMLASKAFERPRYTYLYFGIYFGISTAEIGRMATEGLLLWAGSGYETVEIATLTGLCLLCLFMLVSYLYSRSKLAAWETPANASASPSAEQKRGEPHDLPTCSTLPQAPENTTSVATDTKTRELFSSEFQEAINGFCLRYRLTERETEVLCEVLHGGSRDSIAQKLCLSPETVKTYLKRIYVKVGVSSKQEVIAMVERFGVN